MICGEQAEYGGYLELGFGPAKPRYPGALALNTARNCLAYVLRRGTSARCTCRLICAAR